MRKRTRQIQTILAKLITIDASMSMLAKTMIDMAKRVASVEEMEKITECAAALGVRLDRVTDELTRLTPPPEPTPIESLKSRVGGN